MKEPSTEEWMEIARGFEKYTNFPNCIGAVDGKHIRITIINIFFRLCCLPYVIQIIVLSV